MLGGGRKNYSGEERLPWLCLASPMPDRDAREDSLSMIMSFLLRKIFPWVVEIGLWLTLIVGGITGYQSDYLDSKAFSVALGAVIGFMLGLIPLGLLQITIRNNALLEMMVKEGYGRPRLSLHKGQVVEMPYVASEDQL